MKTLIKIIGLVLALVAGSAQAIPTLYFDGNVKFDSGTGILGISSVLTATDDISPMPTLAGSKLKLSATYLNVTTPRPYLTIRHFNNGQMSVIDGSANTLLQGNFSKLVVKIINGRDSGLLTGTFNAISGSLANEFKPGNLITLGFNLTQSSSTFDNRGTSTAFQDRIDGQIRGQNVSVPEPGILALLALGVVLIGFAGKQMRTGRQFHA